MFSHKGQGSHPFRKHRRQSGLNPQAVNGILSARYRHCRRRMPIHSLFAEMQGLP
jgi:hypothetical protein